MALNVVTFHYQLPIGPISAGSSRSCGFVNKEEHCRPAVANEPDRLRSEQFLHICTRGSLPSSHSVSHPAQLHSEMRVSGRAYPGVADEIDMLARQEPPSSDLLDNPLHADIYMSLVAGKVDSGLAYSFPERIARPHGTVLVEDISSLERHFPAWQASEIPSQTTIVGVVEEVCAVSVYFSSRRTDVATEAGLESADGFRGRGFGPRVTAAWALAIRASGRIPLYTASASDDASLAVARKLGLIRYATVWNIT